MLSLILLYILKHSQHYGTVYLPPLPISLYKSLANGMGSDFTVSDVLATCVGDTVRRYFEMIGHFEQEDDSIVFGCPLAVPTKAPSHYLHESEGLNSLYTPTMHVLPLNYCLTFTDILQTMHDGFELVKRSYITSLFTAIFGIVTWFFKPEDMVDGMKDGIGNACFVWSNVPGPTIPIFIRGQRVSELQCVVSNPFCMMQTCSYNGVVFTNIQVDTRTSIEGHLLSQAYVETMKAAIHELLLPGHEQIHALKVLEEAVSGHDPGPFTSPINEDMMNDIKDYGACETLNSEGQTLAQ